METIIIEEFRKGITDIKSGIHETQEDVTNLQSTIKSVQDENQKLHCELDKVRKQLLLRATSPSAPRRPGLVSEQCARHLAASFILGAARSGRLDSLDSHQRDGLFTEARSILGIETRAALTTTDIPLPTEYASELRELISDFGVARRNMF